MTSNFDILELEQKFHQYDGYTITNYSNNSVVIINRKKFYIAQIYRTSTNNYEVIIASQTLCQRFCRKKFSSAEKAVKKFFKE